MKKLLSIILISFIFYGCSKLEEDPNDINNTSNLILGTWDLVSGSMINTRTYLDPIFGDIIFPPWEYIYDFSYNSISHTYRNDFTYLRINNELDSLGSLVYSDTIIYDYTKTGDTLTMIPYDDVDFIIHTLNNDTLILLSNWIFGSFNIGDSNFVETGYEEVTFIKTNNKINNYTESLQKTGYDNIIISNTNTGIRKVFK